MRDRLNVSDEKVINGVDGEVGTEHHESVMNRAAIFVGSDIDALLTKDVACVDFMLKQKSGDTCDGVAIHDSAIYGRGTSIFREKRSVEVKGTHRGHRPHDLGKHAEGYDDKKVGIEIT